jgi:hypothetical protein
LHASGWHILRISAREIDGVSSSSLSESENNFTVRDGNLVTDFICNGLVTTFKH